MVQAEDIRLTPREVLSEKLIYAFNIIGIDHK